MDRIDASESRELRRRLLLLSLGLKPGELVRATGLSSSKISQVVHCGEAIPHKAVLRIMRLVHPRARELFATTGKSRKG